MSLSQRVNPDKAVKKWHKILEKVQVDPVKDREKATWMAEMAEFNWRHIQEKKLEMQRLAENNYSGGNYLVENAYANLDNTAGMGNYISPLPGSPPGFQYPGSSTANFGIGSGDFGQNLLAVAMKIAAQTIGLDLVPVKPTPGPVIDLYFMDFKYSDTPNPERDEKPQVIKIPAHPALKTYLNAIRRYALSQTNANDVRTFVRVEFSQPDATAAPANSTFEFQAAAPAKPYNANAAALAQQKAIESASVFTQDPYDTADGVSNLPSVTPVDTLGLYGNDNTTARATAGGYIGYFTHLEFLDYGRIDGSAMFRVYRQANTASAGGWVWQPKLNSFSPDYNIADTLGAVVRGNATGPPPTGYAANHSYIAYLPDVTIPTGQPGDSLNTSIAAGVQFIPQVPPVPASSTVSETYGANVSLASALEEFIPGFVSNWHKTHGADRGEDDMYYPGVISIDVFTKRITTQVDKVVSQVQRNELEDIKSQTGIDPFQQIEKMLVDQMSQKVSHQIVDNIVRLGNQNRLEYPNKLPIATVNAALPAPSAVPTGIFPNDEIADTDFFVEQYALPNNVPVTGAVGLFENHMSLQRKLVHKILLASHYIYNEGRIGPATFLVTSYKIAAMLVEAAGYQINPPMQTNIGIGQMYPMGTLQNMTIYVDPYQKPDEMYITLGRKNNPDQPGLVFVPYLMAQSITTISEATFAPRLMLRSRYAVAEVGHFPWKQYMTIRIHDPFNRLG